MSREAHVQFCESLGVRFPGATHPARIVASSAGVMFRLHSILVQNRGGPLPALDDEYRFVVNDIGFTDLL
jgi:hypothetical protein